MPIDYLRMQARTTRMLRQNGALYNVTRKGSVTVIGGVEHKTEEVRFTAVGVKTEYAPGEIDGTVIVNGDVQIVFTSEQEIKIGDVVDIDGTAYRIVNPNPAKPASLVLNMGENTAFLAEITAFVNKAKANQEAVVRTVGIKILNQLVMMSPVGNPELWEVNQTAVSYNRAVYDHNEAQRANPDNLTKTGRLKKKARVVDGMDIKAPPGYTGGRFRGNWQVSFDAPTADETGRIDKTGDLTKAAGNYTLSLFKVGMKAIYFCNNVPYAYPLEMGHSTQAPGGIVRITAAEFQRFFEEAVKEVSR